MPRNLSFLTFCLLMPFLVFSFIGCGNSKKGQLETAEVTGTVTYRDRPVVGAKVIFIGPKDVPQATGITDSEGRFRLTTYNSGDGAVPGDYTVTVSKYIAPASGPPANESMEQAAARAKKKPKKASAGGTSALPAHYADPSKSGLQYKVAAGEKNDFKITLKD
ncbi:MAG: hypothetical protein Tsb009_06220 [Planctomycetaceae bacterium]